MSTSKKVMLSDGSTVCMKMVSLSAGVSFVWADDVAMIARDSVRLPMRRRLSVPLYTPYWLRVNTKYAILDVSEVRVGFVQCRLTPLSALMDYDLSLYDGFQFYIAGSAVDYPRQFWYSLFYGVGQVSRFDY